MKIELRALSAITPYENNPRQNDAAVDAVAESIERFGFRQPIVVDGAGVIVCGHTRWKAAGRLGLAKVPVHVAGDLTPEQVRAYRIADNKTGELADWDLGLLSMELADLQGVDWSLLGFDGRDLERLLGTPDELDERDIPPEPDDPVTQPGDLWILGGHRLVCGDSTDKATVELATDGATVDSVTTDPPYGVDYVGKTRDAIAVPNDGAEGLEPLLSASLGLAFDACRPGATWYVAAPAGPQFAVFASVLAGLGVWRQTLVWVKDSMVLGHSDYHYKHEAVFYGWKPGASHHAPTDRCQTTVWEYDRPKASPDHPTTKPVGLYAEMMRNGTRKGDLVYDAFLGSGTSLLAAEQTGRRCVGIELKPGFCDVIVQRWEAFTGKKTERIAANADAGETAPTVVGAGKGAGG